MPVATLLPPVIDTLKAHGVSELTATRYRLSLPGMAAMHGSMTLTQCGVRDGDVLVLSSSGPQPPAFHCDDIAEAVSQTLHGRLSSQSQHHRTTRLSAALAAGCLTGIGGLALVRNTLTTTVFRQAGATAGIAALMAFILVMSAVLAQRAYRDAMAGLTLSLIATAFAAIAGFLVVPGTPGVANVLLAATAAAVTAVLSMRVTGCGAVTLTAVSCFSTVVAIAAFGGVLTGAPTYMIGASCALGSLGLLGLAARAAVVLAGLSPNLSTDPAEDVVAKAIRADAWLATLLAAFSSSAAVGAVVTVLAGAPCLSCTAYAAATGTLLLLRANSTDSKGILVCVSCAVATIGTTFGVAAVSTPRHGPWIAAATAVLVGAAVCLGFVMPRISLSPVGRRSIELVECSILVAMVPLACWICGLYDTTRGLHLTWA
jgi:type VII secretion integral membrane protein EccD